MNKKLGFTSMVDLSDKICIIGIIITSETLANLINRKYNFKRKEVILPTDYEQLADFSSIDGLVLCYDNSSIKKSGDLRTLILGCKLIEKPETISIDEFKNYVKHKLYQFGLDRDISQIQEYCASLNFF